MCRSVYRSRIRDVDPLKSHLVKSGNNSNTCSSMKRSGSQAVASTSSNLHSSTYRTFWTHTFSISDICTNVHYDSHICLVAYIVDTSVLSDLTKPAITIADVDRFYWNLAGCLQLDVSLLLQNFAKIRHRLPELWKCIQWFTFFSGHSVCSLCMYVSVGTLTVAFFKRSSRNLVRTFGVWIGRTV